ncbi:hypothetical protein BDV96DRAFT_643498 [Lophiotrema nucula]|uniref:Uncharacterized protein n=1 Tax=Lophiotrema nucula TaxID=690887 RepID=A0A6A5ZGK9_9PLEO|nr:hypothetical protein BDV96DRAFT_643498 [Lophiotrema nucula]
MKIIKGCQTSLNLVDMLDPQPDQRTLEIAQQNARESPLLRLPGEIRHEIWGHVVYDPRVDFFNYWKRINRQMDGYLNFLLVSRQIYTEARFLPFTLNTFHLKLDDLKPKGDLAKELPKLLPAQRNAIRSAVHHSWYHMCTEPPDLLDYRNCEIFEDWKIDFMRLLPALQKIYLSVTYCESGHRFSLDPENGGGPKERALEREVEERVAKSLGKKVKICWFNG